MQVGNRRQATQTLLARHSHAGGRSIAPRTPVGPRRGGGRNPAAGRGVRPPAAKAAPGAGVRPAAATAPEPPPWSSRYEQTVGGARKHYLDSTSNYDLAEQQAKQDFGLDQGFNDYKANPYSRAALLQQSFEKANRGTTNSAGLQLYSGSTSNHLGANRAANAEDRDRLMKEYQDSLGEISSGRAEAAARKAEEEQEAYWDRIGEAERVDPESQAAPGPGGGGRRKPNRKPQRQAQTRQAVSNARRAR